MLWGKNKPEFKAGDHIKFKPGIKHPFLNIELSDWYGKVITVEKKGVLIELDVMSLRQLSQEAIDKYAERREYPSSLYVPLTDVELTSARGDSQEEIIKAQEEIIELIDQKNNEPKDKRVYNKWVREFQRTERFREMEMKHQENTDFVLNTFYDFMNNYEGKKINKWTKDSIETVLLHWIPSKVSVPKEDFESYQVVLLRFFQFLEDQKYLKTASFQKLVKVIGPQIVENSQDRSSWGMAKSLMMGALDSGIDVSSKEELDLFLKRQQLQALSKLKKKENKPKVDSTKVDSRQFRGIWLNQKVTVRYPDGRIVENKFKDVKKDLLDGNCELVKK